MARAHPLTADPGERLWRARRRHDHIDALVNNVGGVGITGESAPGWELHYLRNDRLMVVWRFDTREAACAEAAERLRSLERAGWTSHW